MLHLRKHWTIWCLFICYAPPQKTLDHLVSIHILCSTTENTRPFGVYSHYMLHLRNHWTIWNETLQQCSIGSLRNINQIWYPKSLSGRWFSQSPPVSSTNKTDRHDITEILLNVALNTIKQTNNWYPEKKEISDWLKYEKKKIFTNHWRSRVTGNNTFCGLQWPKWKPCLDFVFLASPFLKKWAKILDSRLFIIITRLEGQFISIRSENGIKIWMEMSNKKENDLQISLDNLGKFYATFWFLLDLFDFWCFNATFSNISAISWRPVLVVEEAGEPPTMGKQLVNFITWVYESGAPFL